MSIDELAQALLTHCPAPVRTRDWAALTEAEQRLWVRYAIAMRRAQNAALAASLQRDIAEALHPTSETPAHVRWGDGRVDGLDPEERAEILADAFAKYARHLEGCAQTPCSCGLAVLLRP